MPQKPSWCRRNHRGTAQTAVAQHQPPGGGLAGSPGQGWGRRAGVGGSAAPGGTVPALQVTAGSGRRSSHGGGELRWETVLPRFAYSFMMMKKLIRCPSLHVDSPNTHLCYLFSLISLAPQTTHSTAQNLLPLPSHTGLGHHILLGERPSSRHSCALGDAISQGRQAGLSFSLHFCLHRALPLPAPFSFSSQAPSPTHFLAACPCPVTL